MHVPESVANQGAASLEPAIRSADCGRRCCLSEWRPSDSREQSARHPCGCASSPRRIRQDQPRSELRLIAAPRQDLLRLRWRHRGEGASGIGKTGFSSKSSRTERGGCLWRLDGRASRASRRACGAPRALFDGDSRSSAGAARRSGRARQRFLAAPRPGGLLNGLRSPSRS